MHTSTSFKLGISLRVLIALGISIVLMSGALFATGGPSLTAASDVLGQPDFTTNTSGTTATSLDYPVGVAVDSIRHRMFVADGSNERVLVYNLNERNELVNKEADYVIGQSDFTSSSSSTTQSSFDLDDGGLVFDEVNNRLFVSDESNYRIMVFDTTTITNGMDAAFVLGQNDFTTTSNSANDSSFDYNESTPSYDPVRELLFVPEYDNCRIMVFDVNTITNGEAAVNVIGSDDFDTTDCDTTDSRMDLEYAGSVYDPTTKYLYQSDSNNNRVLVFDTTTITDGMAATYVLGQSDFTSSSSDTSVNTMDYPEALAIDTENQKLFVSDSGNYRVLVFDVNSITNGEDAVDVYGQTDFDSSSSSSASASTLSTSDATGMFFEESTGTLYVADAGNNRVLAFGGPSDFDGVSDATENAAPNGGDGNDDGILDSLQTNVTSIANPVVGDSGYITLETSGCSDITSFIVNAESTATGDADYDYPSGIVDFTLTNCSVGATETIAVYYFGLTSDQMSDLVFRKFDGSTYTTVNDIGLTAGEFAGEDVLIATYQVTDGGALDQDGVADGNIVDPIGAGVLASTTSEVGAPNTGFAYISNAPILVMLGAGTALAITGIYDYRRRQDKPRR